MSQLYCGAGRANITPPEHLIPFMFGLGGARYGKVHDELFVRVLCFESDGQRALIVTFDLDKAPYPVEWLERIEQETGIPAQNVLFMGIHTHTAPITGYRPFERFNFIENKPPEVQKGVREYEALLLERLLEAVRQAVQVQPARFGYGRGKCFINMNRCQRYRVQNADGSVSQKVEVGFNGTGNVDHTLFVLRVENAQTGQPIALLTNYGVHCVAVFLNDCGDGSSFISGDIGGNTSQALEKEYPGAVAMWTSGPAGDVNPVQMVQTLCPDPVTGAPVERRLKGEQAADALLTATVGRHLSDIRSALDTVRCTIDSAPISTAIRWVSVPASTTAMERPDEEPVYDTNYEIRLHLVRIGPLALIGVDGEIYTSLGWAIQQAAGAQDTVVLSHDGSLLPNNPAYIFDDETLAVRRRCGGGLPGGRIYTQPGAVRDGLQKATRALFHS